MCGRFQVLATGLSGLYSSLPARLQVYSEDWHCLDEADWQQVTVALTPKTTHSLRDLDTSLLPLNPQVPALVHFLHSLDFCSAVTKVVVTSPPPQPPGKRITDFQCHFFKVAHPSIKTQLLGYIYNGFLVPVLAPALHKVQRGL